MDNTPKKDLVIQYLHVTPVIEVACKKADVARATFYRWKKSDQEFAKKVSEAMADGTKYINDLAESQLIGHIRDKNLRAIIFWLQNHSDRYTNKIELRGRMKLEHEPLRPEQQEIIEKALRLSNLINPNA